MPLIHPLQHLTASLSKAGLGSHPAIPEGFKPGTDLLVSFDGKQVALGNLFRASECKSAPKVIFSSEDPAAPPRTYTLLLVDPDAPTPAHPKFKDWRHWVLPGLRPPGLEDMAAAAAAEHGEVAVQQTKEALTDYLGPGPKDDSDPHRYLFLLYREPKGGLNLRKDDVGGEEFTQRRSFETAEWAKKQGLELVALNWMRGVGDGWQGQE